MTKACTRGGVLRQLKFQTCLVDLLVELVATDPWCVEPLTHSRHCACTREAQRRAPSLLIGCRCPLHARAYDTKAFNYVGHLRTVIGVVPPARRDELKHARVHLVRLRGAVAIGDLLGIGVCDGGETRVGSNPWLDGRGTIGSDPWLDGRGTKGGFVYLPIYTPDAGGCGVK
jgi:hypothetical protein